MTKIILAFFTAYIFSSSGYSQSGNLDKIKVTDPNHQGKKIDCGLEGSAHDGNNKLGHLAWVENPKKNRSDVPDSKKVKPLKIEDLIALDAVKNKFISGTPVEVTAYVLTVKPGGIESCNCGTKDQNFKDTHIELTPNAKDTSEKYRLIVEITPRLRKEMEKKGLDWSTKSLHTKILHHTITFQGWLFYDEIHEPEAFSTNPENKPNPKTGKRPNWRASCWEIHPITSIQESE